MNQFMQQRRAVEVAVRAPAFRKIDGPRCGLVQAADVRSVGRRLASKEALRELLFGKDPDLGSSRRLATDLQRNPDQQARHEFFHGLFLQARSHGGC